MDWTLRHFESDMVFDIFAHLSSQTLKTKPNNTEQKPHFFFPLVRCFSKIKNNKPTKRRRLGRIEKRQKRYEKLCFFGKTEKKLTAAVVSELNNSTESMKFRWSPSALDTWFILPPTGCYIVFCFSFVFFWMADFVFVFVCSNCKHLGLRVGFVFSVYILKITFSLFRLFAGSHQFDLDKNRPMAVKKHTLVVARCTPVALCKQ